MFILKESLVKGLCNMAQNDIGDWYRGIPMVTKAWFTGSIVVPLVGRFGLINPMNLILSFPHIFYRFQLWRLITAVFYFPITPMTGFHYLIQLYFLYSYSIRLETGVFDGRPADYIFMLLFNWICLVLLMEPMILSALYVWCQLNRDVIVSFWFGTRFKAMYLPWVLVGFNWILRGGGLAEILGILVGHLYFFLTFKYPQDFGGRTLLKTPDILVGSVGFGQAPASRRRPEANNGGVGGRHNWGQGNPLGGD
ncbi:putative derlin-1 [Apostichopus japonicus]|uniref:Derlin n=1 Tax=Stichopus japonicus TaxID=307972 RepID=A0A2G8KS95_STIJA|nr:putative derlin-1 [Apostichopus japonicus]